jgi:hypothetical protein
MMRPMWDSRIEKPKTYVQFVRLSKMRERVGFLSSFISFATVGRRHPVKAATKE